jgi:translation initiation factor IF-1
MQSTVNKLQQTPSLLTKPHTETDAQAVRQNPVKTDFNINRKGFIETEGVIEEALPSTSFRVELQNGHKILARLSGRMRMHRIMLVPGGRVKIEMSQYDLTKGRITYRL